MKSLPALSLSALMAVTLALPTMTTEAEARKGRNTALAAGAVLGIAAAAALSSPRRAYADDGYYVERRSYGSGYRSQCRKWNYRCDRGNDWACEKFDRNC